MISNAPEIRQQDAEAAAIVRLRDRDRYWSVLFARPTVRSSLMALYAFDAEVQRIRSVVSEPMVGQIRMQWWRDAVDLAAVGTKTGNPVADALTRTILRHKLPKERFVQLIDARSAELFGDAPADHAALKTFLDKTVGVVFGLAAMILGEQGPSAIKAASRAGVAYGLTQLLRTLPQSIASGRSPLPLNISAKSPVLDAFHSAGILTPELARSLGELRGVADGARLRFKAVASELKQSAWPAFLPLAVVKPYLKLMNSPAFNPVHDMATLSPVYRFWLIWRAARRGMV